MCETAVTPRDNGIISHFLAMRSWNLVTAKGIQESTDLGIVTENIRELEAR